MAVYLKVGRNSFPGSGVLGHEKFAVLANQPGSTSNYYVTSLAWVGCDAHPTYRPGDPDPVWSECVTLTSSKGAIKPNGIAYSLKEDSPYGFPQIYVGYSESGNFSRVKLGVGAVDPRTSPMDGLVHISNTAPVGSIFVGGPGGLNTPRNLYLQYAATAAVKMIPKRIHHGSYGGGGGNDGGGTTPPPPQPDCISRCYGSDVLGWCHNPPGVFGGGDCGFV